MFREFNVKFEDVEIIGGADNLLEGTEITKVIVRGDNNKMSSLDSMLKDCNELDTIDGELDLNGVSDIDNLLEGTELVKNINLKNINNENISANNSFPHIEEINIGGELYNKKAMQNVIASKDWTFDNINYQGTVGDNIVTKEVNATDDNKTTIQDTLEQKAKGIEIIGQTYENLVVGSGEATLLDELTLESVDGSPNEFTPHIEQPVCVECIGGETYQNLIEGKGEYKLTDTFSTTWTESNNSIENPPSMIEIPEIWGNTIQGYANVLTPYVIKEHWEKANWITNATIVNKYTINTTSAPNSGSLESAVSNDNSLAIQLKANTTYALKIECPSFGSTSYMRCIGENGNTGDIIVNLAGKKGCFIQKFTTTSTGKITFGVRPDSSSSSKDMKVFCVEGDVDLSLYDFGEFDLEYIQSVGDLYVDESGEPILDEEGNEQYKLDILSYDYKYMPETSDNRTGLSDATKDGDWSVINHNIGDYTRYSTTNKTINRADYGDLVYASFKIVKLDNRKFNHTNFCTRTGGYTYHFMTKNEYNDLPVNVEHFQSTIQSESHPDGIILDMSFCEYSKELEFSCKVKDIVLVNLTKWFGKGNEPTREWCDENIKYVEHEDGEILYGNKNKTTILMPQPLRRAGYERYGYNNTTNQYDKPIRDLLYYDAIEKKFFIKKYVMTNYVTGNSFEEDRIYQQYNTREIIPPVSINQTLGYVYAIRFFSESIDKSNLHVIHRGGTASQSVLLATLREEFTVEESNALFSDVAMWYAYYKNDTELYYEIVETKILEKPSLEAYSPKTYITTSAEIQPSQMTVTNKKVDFIPLGLQPNKDYTLQLDSIGKEDKPITVNLGGTEATIQPINDTSKHHKVVVRTPSTLTTDKLDLSGEGVVVNDVMLFEGGGNEIKQDVEYVEGIESIGELVENLFPIDVIENIKTNYDEYKNSYYKKEIQLQPNTTYSVRYLGKARGYGYGLIIGGKENITGSHSWFCDMNLNSGITTKTFTTDLTGKLTFGISFIGIDSISSFLRQETKVQIEIGNNVSSEYFEGERYKIDILSTNTEYLKPITNGLVSWVNYEDYSASTKTIVDRITNKIISCECDSNGIYATRGIDIGSLPVIKTIECNGMHRDTTTNENGTTINTCTIFYGSANGVTVGSRCRTNDNYSYCDSITGHNFFYNTPYQGGFQNNLNAEGKKNEYLNGGLFYCSLKTNVEDIPLNFGYFPHGGATLNRYKDILVYDRELTDEEIQHNKMYHRLRSLVQNECLKSTQSILLPQTLNKIGDIKDKFYWDDNKGHYCIEEKTIEIVLNGSEYWSIQSTLCTDVCFLAYLKIFDSSLNTRLDYINNKFPKLGFNYSEKKDVEGFYTSWGGLYLNIFNDRLPSIDIEGFKQWLSENPIVVLCALQEPNIIDLPHLNKKYSLDTYMPTTYLECTNSPMQPSRILLESDTVRYKPSALETDTDYTIQFECKEKSDKKVKLNLGGTEKEVDAEVGLNHVSITTPSEIDTILYKDRLFLSGVGNKVADVIVAKGEMNQYPSYFNGVQSVGELQDDGTYKIEVSTNNGGFKNLFDINNFFVNQNNRGSYVVSSEDNSITSNYTDWNYTVETNIDLKAGKEYLIKLDFEAMAVCTSKYSLIMLGDKGYNLNSYIHADFEKIIEYAPNTEDKLKTSFNIIYTPSSDKTVYFGLSSGLRNSGSIKIKNIEIAEYSDNLNMDIPLKSHNVAITSNNPLAKGDKLYWNKSNKRYEIDRGGDIEVPTVTGDVIDLPRLYQRENTYFSTSTGNIKPSKIKLDYNDLD